MDMRFKTKNLKLFIAYYYNGENEKDAELYLGKNGTETEFIKYWKTAYSQKIKKEDICGVYSIEKEMGIDGENYKINIKLTKETL